MKPETACESFKNPKFKKLLELLDFLLKKTCIATLYYKFDSNYL